MDACLIRASAEMIVLASIAWVTSKQMDCQCAEPFVLLWGVICLYVGPIVLYDQDAHRTQHHMNQHHRFCLLTHREPFNCSIADLPWWIWVWKISEDQPPKLIPNCQYTVVMQVFCNEYLFLAKILISSFTNGCETCRWACGVIFCSNSSVLIGAHDHHMQLTHQ